MLLGFSIVLLLGAPTSSENILELTECMPQLADKCFMDFTSELITDNTDSFCNYSQDCLECAKDIIDTDCSLEDGRDNFDFWINAMLSVQSYICKHEVEALKVLRKHMIEECWDFKEFIDCIDRKTQITHVLDMMLVRQDIKECNWIMIAFSTCNVLATKNPHCQVAQEVVNELLHIFLQETQCAITKVCSGTAPSWYSLLDTLVFSIVPMLI